MPDFPSPYLPVEKFIPPPNPDGFIGRHESVSLYDDVDITVRLEFTIPDNFLDLLSVNAELVPEGTGSLRRSVYAEWGKKGENYNAGSDSIPAGEVSVTTDKVELIDLKNALNGLEPGDAVGVEFTRYGSHVNDTVEASCHLLGIRLKVKVQ